MEDKTISESESLAIITEMIDRTKCRLHIGDGNMLLLWGYTSLAVTLLTFITHALTHHQASNWLWFLIWIIGGSASAHICRKHESNKAVRTYTDLISSRLWTLVGYCAIFITAVCLALMLFGGTDCWIAMLIFGLLIVGIAIAVQGFIIREKSLVTGGSVGIAAGIIVMCCSLARIAVAASWGYPLIATSFLLMLVIPGHILNRKARRQC